MTLMAPIEGVGRGHVTYRYLGYDFRIYGGPYRQKPANLMGIKMAAEIAAPCEVDIPTVDFQVPPVDVMRDGLHKAIALAVDSPNSLYAGCMGGIGRTGLFLAIMARATGESDPVAFVRRNYFAHAVETDKQRQYIAAFDVKPARRRLFWAIAAKRSPRLFRPVVNQVAKLAFSLAGDKLAV